jgi:hypothetical protein
MNKPAAPVSVAPAQRTAPATTTVQRSGFGTTAASSGINAGA